MKFTLQNSFMHDTDNHYFDVRQHMIRGWNMYEKQDGMAYSQLFV